MNINNNDVACGVTMDINDIEASSSVTFIMCDLPNPIHIMDV